MPHPLSLFRYCPRCGSRHFEISDSRAKRCGDCGFTYYHNASASTVAANYSCCAELWNLRVARSICLVASSIPAKRLKPAADARSLKRLAVR